MQNNYIKFIFFICLSISTVKMKGQSEKKVYPEPEFTNKPYYYNEATNELADAQPGNLIQDSRTSGYNSEEEFYYVEGEKSNFRIKKGQKIYFLLKWSNDYLDPNAEFVLMKMKYNPRKKRREVILQQSSSYSSNAADVKMFFKTKKVQEILDENNHVENVLRLFIIENIEPGEYVWKFNSSDALFFGVDE
jgi:hypothetical protein